MLEEENGKSWNLLEWDCALRVIFTFTVYPFFVKHYAICGNCIKICLPHTLILTKVMQDKHCFSLYRWWTWAQICLVCCPRTLSSGGSWTLSLDLSTSANPLRGSWATAHFTATLSLAQMKPGVPATSDKKSSCPETRAAEDPPQGFLEPQPPALRQSQCDQGDGSAWSHALPLEFRPCSVDPGPPYVLSKWSWAASGTITGLCLWPSSHKGWPKSSHL